MTLLPSSTFTSIRSLALGLFTVVSTVSLPPSMSGVVRMFSMARSGTGSSHTVCQMPLTGVYQICPGLLTCLPRACLPLSVGSHTRTTTSLSPFFSACVMSNAKGVNPPQCSPSLVPFTHTVVFQSTAPKFSNTRCPFQWEGTEKVRRYHNSLFSPNSFPTPESADSTAKGTRISPSYVFGIALPDGRMAYCQSPFRFTHSVRSIKGRGYSGNTLLTSTCAAHSVTILLPAGFHWA